MPKSIGRREDHADWSAGSRAARVTLVGAVDGGRMALKAARVGALRESEAVFTI